MGLDARIRYTKMVIQESFAALLKERPINRITVKEICEGAEINRATFYKYYADAYDLLDKIEEQVLDSLRDIIEKNSDKGVRSTLTEILCQMKDNENFYTALFSENGDPGFTTKIFQMCYKEQEENLKKYFPDYTKTQRAWLYVYAAQGSSGILNYWIQDEMTESPEEVVGFLEDILEKLTNGK